MKSLDDLKSDNDQLVNAMLVNIFSDEIPELTSYFDTKIIDASRGPSGTVNYMTLYELLPPRQKLIFERVYDSFNRKRERSIEMSAWKLSKIATEEKARLMLPKKSNFLLWNWKFAVEKYFKDKDVLANSEELKPYSKYLLKLGPSPIAHIIVEKMFGVVLYYGTFRHRNYVTSLASSLGKAIHREVLEAYFDQQVNSSKFVNTHSSYKLYSKYGVMPDEKWTPRDELIIGSAMIEIALNVLKIQVRNPRTGIKESKPAFYRTVVMKAIKKIGIIRPNEKVSELVMAGGLSKELNEFNQKSFPMLVKPRPWSSFDSGGFMYTNLELLTQTLGKTSEGETYIQKAFEDHSLDPMLDSLSAISNVPWSINRKVLDVVEQIWDSGKELLGIPGLPTTELKIDVNLPKHKQYEERKRLEQQIVNERTNRTTYGLALEMARYLVGKGDRFYVPLRIDFRGRCYPHTSSGLTHMGRDSVRGLFQFWYGKPLGSRGLYWLKVHVANMYGNDKITNDRRKEFTDTNLDQILDSATKPLDGNKWWMGAANPIQCLAACMELADVLESENPEAYISHLPVNQDGTCNGLQHFAALGGDIEGASQVNMVGNKEPKDIYSKVAEIVSELIHRDAMAGDNPIAEWLDGKITRKVVKAPVMTNVYGVTNRGILLQVLEQLDYIEPKEAAYVGRLIEMAINKLFTSADAHKIWLQSCADIITESVRADLYGPEIVNNNEFLKQFTTVVVWKSPLGLPVVQPYRKSKHMIIRTPLQSLAIKNPFLLAFTDRRKQRQGIVPNVIHSLDATHMLMSGSACVAQGIIFASVHDSFWCHACDIDRMNIILRQEFVNLYSQDLSRDLWRQWNMSYNGFMRLVKIDRASEAAKKILELRKNYDADKLKNETDILRYELEQEFYKWKNDKPTDANKNHCEDVFVPSQILKQYPTEYFSAAKPKSRGTTEFTTTNRTLSNNETVGSTTEGLNLLLDDDTHLNDPLGKSAEMNDHQQNPPHQRRTFIKVFVPTEIPKPPTRGNLDITKVRQSPYFFA